MNSQQLLLDRIEFSTIKIDTADVESVEWDENFPQITLNVDNLKILARSSLIYPDEELSDPKHFYVSYGIKIDATQEHGKIPYAIEVEVKGFFRYLAGDEFVGAERFRAIRFSAYPILYGAIREMVSSLTARSRYGMWQLPARTFSTIARNKAEEDEQERQRRLADQGTERMTKARLNSPPVKKLKAQARASRTPVAAKKKAPPPTDM